MPFPKVARYDLPYPGTSLVIARGSVVEFDGDAIVNAANESCLGGGGVDGAITREGGPDLAQDRWNLPILLSQPPYDVRCPVGSAVITGPGTYGRLPSYVIHAVGPDFQEFGDQREADGIQLLTSAYQKALDLANQHALERVAFSLLSAGVFRGHMRLEDILDIAVQAIIKWTQDMTEPKKEQDDNDNANILKVKEIHLCAFTPQECMLLKEICDRHLHCDNTKPMPPPSDTTETERSASDAIKPAPPPKDTPDASAPRPDMEESWLPPSSNTANPQPEATDSLESYPSDECADDPPGL